jgi:hypothetical protein
VRHKSISFSQRNPLLTNVRRSSVFNITFFHSFVGLGRGEEGGDDDDWSASPASSRLLFFDALVFELFARDPFILHVMGVFTHIRSGAMEVGGLRQSAGVDLNHLAAVAVTKRQRSRSTCLI